MTRLLISCLLFLLIGIFNVVTAQSTYFNKSIEYNNQEHYDTQIEGTDSVLFTLGSSRDSGLTHKTAVYLSKYNLKGERLWIKKYGEGQKNYSVERSLTLRDSILYFIIQDNYLNSNIGGRVIIKKLNLEGKELGSYEVELMDSLRIQDSQLLEDGTYVNTGYRKLADSVDADWHWFINRIDTNGNELFYKEYSQWVHKSLGFTVERIDAGYVMGGRSVGYNINKLDQSIIMKTDSVGNIEWVRDFGDRWVDYEAFATVSDSGRIIGTMLRNMDGDDSWPWDGLYRNYVVSMDLDGNILWDKFTGKIDDFTHARSVYPKRLEDGNILLFGAHPDYYWGRVGYLHKITPEGDSIWSRYYRYLRDRKTYHYLQDAIELPDKGLVVSGYYKSFGDTVLSAPESRGWLMKIDSMGCLFEGCDTICEAYDLEYSIIHDSGFTYHVDISPPVVNSYSLVFKGNYNNLIDNSYSLKFAVTFLGPGDYTFEFYGEDQCRIWSRVDTTIEVKEPTHVERISGSGPEQLSLYPNPAHNILYIATPPAANKNLTYQITTATGRHIQGGRLSTEGAIRLNEMAAGVYLLQLYDESGVLVGRERFVKE